jgi:FKBP-type peptidyl-prolyl cis-trans isomerase
VPLNKCRRVSATRSPMESISPCWNTSARSSGITSCSTASTSGIESSSADAVSQKGSSEALKMMPVGAKWELYVPSDRAYGDDGYGDDIASGSTLVFEVELLRIKPSAS